MSKSIVRKVYIALFAFGIAFLCAGYSNAQKIDEAKIKEAIDGLSHDYKDVPSSLTCKPPASEAEKIICSDRILLLMERLDTMASIYMVENGTHHPISHNKRTVMQDSLILTIRKLKTADQIRKAYIENTNNSLGGESPYYVDNQ